MKEQTSPFFAVTPLFALCIGSIVPIVLTLVATEPFVFRLVGSTRNFTNALILTFIGKFNGIILVALFIAHLSIFLVFLLGFWFALNGSSSNRFQISRRKLLLVLLFMTMTLVDTVR